MKRQRIKGLAIITDIKTHKNVEKIPFDMVVGGRKIIPVIFKMNGLYHKYNTVNYQITYQYDSVENLKSDLDYGIRSVGKLINA